MKFSFRRHTAYYHSRPTGSQEAYLYGRWAHIRRVGFIVVFIKRQDMEVGRPQASYPTQDLAPRGRASRSRASNAAEEADTYGGSNDDISTREQPAGPQSKQQAAPLVAIYII